MSPKSGSVCAIQGCNYKKSRKHIFYFRFPKVRDVAKKWAVACNRNDLMELLESQNADYLHRMRFMVCSYHFETKYLKNKDLLSKGLIKGAVPTRNLIQKRKNMKSFSDTMVEMDEVHIKVEEQMCHGCLSTDRRTTPLGYLKEMFSTLVGPAITKDTTVYCCWECIATLRRLHKFQKQLKHVYYVLTQTSHNLNSSLSTLTTTQKDYYDQEIQHLDNTICDKITLDYKEDKNANVKKEKHENAQIEIKNDFNVETVDENESTNDIDTVDVDELMTDVENKQRDVNVTAFDNDDKSRNMDIAVKKRKLNSWKNIKKEYKSYARLIRHKNWNKPHTQYFTQVQLDETEIELCFLKSDRKRQGYKMRLKCKTCSLIYGRKIDLDRHNNLNHHEPNTPYKCLHCNESQLSLESLKEHWRTHSVFYRCVMCSGFVFPCSLALHLSRSHVNVYACTSCKLHFSSLVSFSEHYNKNHPFICDYCSKKCALRSVLEKHIKNHHTAHSCVACDRQFDSYRLYRAHCREMHPHLLNIGVEPELTYCVECDRQFPSLALYKKHINSKHTQKPTKLKRTPCPECGKAFNKNSDMLLHYNFSHVKVTKYHCDLCDKYFLKMYGLRTHMESVHLKLPKPKNKICDLCGRAFQSNSVLDNHRRTHTGERPFKCEFCPAAFAQKGAMRIHQRKQHSAN